jgi:hypothetical protein
MDPSRNMAGYRSRLAQCTDQPAVPFVAILLKDMLFYDQANIDQVDTLVCYCYRGNRAQLEILMFILDQL